MKETLQNLLDHLQSLSYVQVQEAHAIRYKTASVVQDPSLSARINRLKFNTWFLDPPEKRKRIFEKSRRALASMIRSKLDDRRTFA